MVVKLEDIRCEVPQTRPGGQHVGITSPKALLTHIATGTRVFVPCGRSLLTNRAVSINMLTEMLTQRENKAYRGIAHVVAYLAEFKHVVWGTKDPEFGEVSDPPAEPYGATLHHLLSDIRVECYCGDTSFENLFYCLTMLESAMTDPQMKPPIPLDTEQ